MGNIFSIRLTDEDKVHLQQWSEKFFTPEALELSRFAEAKV